MTPNYAYILNELKNFSKFMIANGYKVDREEFTEKIFGNFYYSYINDEYAIFVVRDRSIWNVSLYYVATSSAPEVIIPFDRLMNDFMPELIADWSEVNTIIRTFRMYLRQLEGFLKNPLIRRRYETLSKNPTIFTNDRFDVPDFIYDEIRDSLWTNSELVNYTYNRDLDVYTFEWSYYVHAKLRAIRNRGKWEVLIAGGYLENRWLPITQILNFLGIVYDKTSDRFNIAAAMNYNEEIKRAFYDKELILKIADSK